MLVTLAHGSRHPEAAPLIADLTDQVAENLGVSSLCLDLLEPDLAPLEDVLETGTTVTIVPLLFTQAFHARVDIPALFDPITQAYGEQVRFTDILGTGQDIAQLIVAKAQADAPQAASYGLYSVGSSDKRANDAVRELAREVSAILDKPVSVHFATGSRAVMPEDAEHFIPLFSTHGLLLDKLKDFPSVSAPLGLDLHDIILNRYLNS
ncbi:MAG: CbiX/SirB N-terminal domain-containing protein [Corynebacterium sp.]|nr:CbiX/SirB N-terminal domain-containing protein [Corynebacterium sp.]